MSETEKPGPWIGWNGGQRPVHPKTVVEAVTLSGSRDVGAAERWVWKHSQAIHDPRELITYRVIREHREPREVWEVNLVGGVRTFFQTRVAAESSHMPSPDLPSPPPLSRGAGMIRAWDSTFIGGDFADLAAAADHFISEDSLPIGAFDTETGDYVLADLRAMIRDLRREDAQIDSADGRVGSASEAQADRLYVLKSMRTWVEHWKADVDNGLTPTSASLESAHNLLTKAIAKECREDAAAGLSWWV